MGGCGGIVEIKREGFAFLDDSRRDFLSKTL
jgi:hypothetical protein